MSKKKSAPAKQDEKQDAQSPERSEQESPDSVSIPAQNNGRAPTDDESDEADTLLEEEEMMAVDEGGSRFAVGEDPGPGKILVPRIAPRGITLDRLHGGSKLPKSKVEMIAVRDDRVGKLKRLGRSHYLQLIMPLHVELLKLQNHVKAKGLRVVVLFEGRDAAGKGGTIKRFVEHMNPRGCRVVALDKPSDEERQQWYFQRYVQHLPTAGEIVLFDRSWYNRAMVERVMGFCQGDEVREFLRSAPEFERMLIRSGIILLKFYFSVSKNEQMRRFQKRLDDPLKQWKLSPVDLESQDKWNSYRKAKEDMFFYTSTADCPWVVIKSDDKKRARINAIRHFLGGLDYPKDYPQMLGIDPRVVRTVTEELSEEG